MVAKAFSFEKQWILTVYILVTAIAILSPGNVFATEADPHGQAPMNSECGWRMAALSDVYSKDARRLFLEEEVEKAKQRSANHENYVEHLHALFQELPTFPLYLIGEEHATVYNYMDIIVALKFAKPKIDTLFLEAHSSYNGAFEAYFDKKIDYEELTRYFRGDSNVTHYLNRDLMELTRAMGIKVVGIEDSATGSSMSGIWNLSERNTYSAKAITEYFQHNWEPRQDSWGNQRRQAKTSQQGIYLGGAGHLMHNGDIPFSSNRVQSIAKLLDGWVPNQKIYLLNTGSRPIKGLKDDNSAFKIDLNQPVAFRPPSGSPSVQDKLEGINLDLFRWSDFNLVIIYPERSSEERQGFTKSRTDFFSEVLELKKRFPDLIAEPTLEQEIFRVDSRTPAEVAAAKGFWPNPGKQPGTIEEHIKKDSSGTSSYISASFNASFEFLRGQPELRYVFAQFIDIDGQLFPMNEEKWKNPLSYFSVEQLRRAKAVWHFNQYRIKEVEGARIVGGKMAHEAEVIVRGVPLKNIDAYQLLSFSEPLRISGVDATTPHIEEPQFGILSRASPRTQSVGQWVPLNH